MTLTVCVGSSGSGKTTFLNDVHKSHKCTYIRQYHNMRPYITVKQIPNFDPTKLPYWEIYEREGTADTIKVGGTMAGEFTAGLSGGQRKLMLFELIVQRSLDQEDLLIVLDEPFAGVTDDFVPFIVERLNIIREKHNVLLVTNDHVETLSGMSDNKIVVSAIDRTKVQINDREGVDRDKAIKALSMGKPYEHKESSADMKFFWDVEVANNGALMGIAMFTMFTFALFTATFWNSAESSAPLVLIGGGMIAYFCMNPYLLSLVEWRIAMNEEAEALIHASKGINKALKTALTIFLIFIISWIEFGIVNVVIDGLSSIKYWVAMFFDSMSLTFTLICLGLYTNMPFQTAQILGSLPFLLMIFLSTTFSPGAGIPVIKELRYMYTRFYFWCMVPSLEGQMEGCPSETLNIILIVLSGLLFLGIFLVVMAILTIKKKLEQSKNDKCMKNLMNDEEFKELQAGMYGQKSLYRFQTKPTNESGSGSDTEANV